MLTTGWLATMTGRERPGCPACLGYLYLMLILV